MLPQDTEKPKNGPVETITPEELFTFAGLKMNDAVAAPLIAMPTALIASEADPVGRSA